MKKFYNGNTCAAVDIVAFWLKNSPSEMLPTYTSVSLRQLWPAEGSRNVDGTFTHLTYFAMCTVSSWLIKVHHFASRKGFMVFAKLRNTIIRSAVIFVLLSAWKSSARNGWILIEFDIRILLKNMPRRFKFHYNMTRLTRILHADLCTARFWQSLWILLRMRNVKKKKL
jgi:hypothetical protein